MNLLPTVSDVFTGTRVSVRPRCGCTHELLLAWGRVWHPGLPSKAISQSRLKRTFPGLLLFTGVTDNSGVSQLYTNKLLEPDLYGLV